MVFNERFKYFELKAQVMPLTQISRKQKKSVEKFSAEWYDYHLRRLRTKRRGCIYELETVSYDHQIRAETALCVTIKRPLIQTRFCSDRRRLSVVFCPQNAGAASE